MQIRQVGDVVRWSMRIRGKLKRQYGVVAATVPPGKTAASCCPAGHRVKIIMTLVRRPDEDGLLIRQGRRRLIRQGQRRALWLVPGWAADHVPVDGLPGGPVELLWAVKYALPFSALKQGGVPCSSPERGLVRWIPVFCDRAAALKFMGGREDGVQPIAVPASQVPTDKPVRIPSSRPVGRPA